MKVLVCGGRDFDDYKGMKDVLDSFCNISKIIHGGARGADALAGRYAKENDIPCDPYPAFWSEHGRSAGPRRNIRMLQESHPDVVIAFPGGPGTAHMTKIATEAGYSVHVIKYT